MKHLKTLFIAAALLIGSTSFMNAQSKVAHINTQELIAAMPEMKSAQAELEKLAKSYETDIKTMATELDSKLKLYNQEAPTKTEDENKTRMKEVQGMEQSIVQYQQTAQQELAKKEAELIKPITDKAKAAIEKVARAKGVDYVLDSMTGQGVLFANGIDLMQDVKTELGF